MSRARYRFPLYAPMALEARLNPSAVTMPLPLTSPTDWLPTSDYPAEIYLAPDDSPPPEPGDPPVLDPAIPIGPAGPA